MKKLRLELEEITVDTFEAGELVDWRGTVEGQDSDDPLTVYPELSCACTHDPAAADCYVSGRHCSEAEPCIYTIDTTCTCNPYYC